MRVFSLNVVAGTVALLIAIGTGNKEISFETSVDPGGCLVEHVAVDPDVEQFHYDGLSPDGKTLAVGYRAGEESGLFLLDLTTGERTEIPGLDNGAVFSPDGTKILNILPTENGRTDIVEYDLASGEMTIIARHQEWEWLASYSSDGNLILFNSYRTGASDIYTYRKSDGQLKRWTDFDGYEAHAQFSPDDSKILFNRQENGSDFNLHVVDVKTGEISQLTSDLSEEGYASWSPDGRTIVFSSDRERDSGETDLFLMKSNGEDIRRITNDPTKDSYPFFSPDGRYVYFNSDREPSGLYRIEFNNKLDCIKAARTKSEQNYLSDMRDDGLNNQNSGEY